MMDNHASIPSEHKEELMGISKLSFATAKRRGKRSMSAFPAAVAVRYDRRSARLLISLSSGVELSFSPKRTQGLEAIKPADLMEVQISASGLGLHFPRLDADLYVPALLRGFLGSQPKKAVQTVAEDEPCNTPSN